MHAGTESNNNGILVGGTLIPMKLLDYSLPEKASYVTILK
jgi:hypothetical protein